MPTVALQQVTNRFARNNAGKTLEKPIALKFITTSTLRCLHAFRLNARTVRFSYGAQNSSGVTSSRRCFPVVASSYFAAVVRSTRLA